MNQTAHQTPVNLEDFSKSNKLLLSLERLGERDTLTDVQHVCSEWFKKELSFLEKKSQSETHDDTCRQGLVTCLQWLYGTYLLRWYVPATHQLMIKEVESNGTLQEFVFERISILCFSVSFLNPPVDKEKMILFDLFKNLCLTNPNLSSELQRGFSRQILEATAPNYNYLKRFFFENHWLLVLFFVLLSYKFLGYDQDHL